MIAFVQHFGLDSGGGGPKIYRGLLPGLNEPFFSICTHVGTPPPTSIATELSIAPRPYFGRLERTRFSPWLRYMLPCFEQQFRQQLIDALEQFGATKVHALAHELDFWQALQAARHLNLPYYLTVHDHILEVQRKRQQVALAMMQEAWQAARAVAVICDPLGEDYCRRFGKRDYVVITDGCATVAEKPLPVRSDRVSVYFMGLVHGDYSANFKAISEAISMMQASDSALSPSLTIRGTMEKKLLPGTQATYLPWGDDEAIKKDMSTADLLYLPLPFQKELENFPRFSLSTKMVTYLASGVPILYHGPRYAAAAKLLEEHDAAIIVDTLNPDAITKIIKDSVHRRHVIAENGLRLAVKDFSLAENRRRFAELFI